MRKANYEKIVETIRCDGEISKTSVEPDTYDILKVENFQRILNLAGKEDRITTGKDLLICIDLQNDFMEGGSLAVPGAKQDVARLTKWIYNNMDKFSDIMCTLDSHVPFQIFHPCWWKDETGENPKPYTVITLEDFEKGKWNLAVVDKILEAITGDYLQYLEEKSKKNLCIWPYHCLKGTWGAALEQSFMQMLLYYSIVSGNEPIYVEKGMEPNFSEMYGFLEPEFSGYVGTANKNKDFLQNILFDKIIIGEYEKIYIAGEAASHCVLESVVQLCKKLKYKELTSRIVILQDCMTSIAGFEEATNGAFKKLQSEYGINIQRTTDVIM